MKMMAQILKVRLWRKMSILALLIGYFGWFGWSRLNWQNNIPIHVDELDYVGNSFLWSDYIKGNYDRNLWSYEWSYDQPHLYHFLTGIFLRSYYGPNWVKSLERNGFLERSMMGGAIVSWSQEIADKVVTKDNFGVREKAGELIMKVRRMSLVFYLITVWLLLWLAKEIGGKKAILLVGFLLAMDYSAIMEWMLKATADSLLVLLITCWLASWWKLIKTKNNWWIWVLAVLSGLAAATKLNGWILEIGVVVGLCGYFELFCCGRMLHYGYTVLSGLISGLLFYILTPFIFVNTLRNFLFLFIYRLDVISRQLTTSVDVLWHANLVQKCIIILGELFGNNSDWRWTSLLPVTMVLLVSGWRLVRERGERKLMLGIILILILFFLVTIPLSWRRYFLPMEILIIMIPSFWFKRPIN